MIECFVGFMKETPTDLLAQTLTAWEIAGVEPVAVQCRADRFELHRRVVAENLAVADYLLAELGYGPTEPDFAKRLKIEMRDRTDCGLFIVSAGAVACRKGIITHWPQLKSETYRPEHAEAFKRKGYGHHTCKTVHCHPLAGSLPS